ncbi:MAG: TIGR03619 family F420-dependent LLM class oxidoreductase [Actinobacteria bacterium]|nr:TIGR03619 family F420-dependent LLM class oxidoreductase [Actinomycetota bacterium]
MKFWLALAFVETEQALALARMADAAGYHGITVSDHLFAPQKRQALYPYSPDGAPPFTDDAAWPDPWVLIGAMAAVTQQIRFTTNVYVAPLRELFTVAKLVSTASVISGGRVTMGAAPGWCEEEFDQVGQRFKGRGARLEEMIDACRKLWAGGWVEHHGNHFDFDPLRIEPVPAAPVPIYIGGHSERALARAARIGDGWIGNAYSPDDAEHYLGLMRDQLKAADRLDDPDFEIIIALKARPSNELHDRVASLGVTGLLCAPWLMASSLEDRITAIEGFGSYFCA